MEKIIQILINSYINDKKNENFIKILFHNLFYKPFDDYLDKIDKTRKILYNNYNIDISKNIILKMYNINLNLIFIFNYLPIIVTYLKCIFYKKHISKDIELSELEISIYNYYKKYIVSEDPLIFKFVDFSRNNLNIYDYKYLQNIYYEYIVDENIWKIHQYDNSKTQLLTHNIGKQSYKFYKLKLDGKSPLLNKDFVLNELDINKDEFNTIYESFNYNQYSNTNNGYYYYSGDIDNPMETDISKLKKRLPKFSNIIGCSSVTTTNTTKNLNSKLSRIIISLSIIYSKKIEEKNKNIYFKNSLSTGSFKLHLPNIAEFEQFIHIIYCIIDQIYELNHKIILDIIINNKDILENIWLSDNKYNFKEFYSYNFNNKDIFELDFSEEQYNNLKSFLDKTYKINITDKYINIIEKINSKSNLLYNYKPIITILDYFANIHKNDKSTLLNNTLKEHYYTKLITILLYDLDSTKFYNKRWLLNYYESCLLNPKVLDIDIKPNTQYDTCKPKCGDTTSIPNNSVISSSKNLDKRKAKKLIEIDS